jgi:hypothetical protein|tara:strand:- start:2913 stop:3125 length:213 start_codon:yes stop_codon:yes gene_type:complete
MINRELITKGDIMYEVVSSIPAHMFTNKDGSVNQQVLGMYVNDYQADRVLQREGKFLICKQVEEANIINE